MVRIEHSVEVQVRTVSGRGKCQAILFHAYRVEEEVPRTTHSREHFHGSRVIVASIPSVPALCRPSDQRDMTGLPLCLAPRQLEVKSRELKCQDNRRRFSASNGYGQYSIHTIPLCKQADHAPSTRSPIHRLLTHPTMPLKAQAI
jgi:hypothetical protein